MFNIIPIYGHPASEFICMQVPRLYKQITLLMFYKITVMTKLDMTKRHLKCNIKVFVYTTCTQLINIIWLSRVLWTLNN